MKTDSQTRIMRALGAEELVNKVNLLHTKGQGIFQPTATTSALLLQASNLVKKNTSVLDLGCGWGIIGLELALKMKGNISLSMSDLSENSVEAAKYNAKVLGVTSKIEIGSIFEPWNKKEFDLIISDISGVSEEVPFLSKWFQDIPSSSGSDGLQLVSTVIRTAGEYLKNTDSKILMPLISLSNVAKGEKLMHTYFMNVKLLSQKEWNLELESKFDLKMEELKTNCFIDFSKVGNVYKFFTRIYELSNPIVRIPEKEHENDE